MPYFLKSNICRILGGWGNVNSQAEPFNSGLQEIISKVCRVVVANSFFEIQRTFKDFEPRFSHFRGEEPRHRICKMTYFALRCFEITVLVAEPKTTEKLPIERHGNRRLVSRKKLDLAALLWLACNSDSGQIHTFLMHFFDFNANISKNSSN